MTSPATTTAEKKRIARTYVVATTLLAFACLWWAIAKTPFPGSKSDAAAATQSPTPDPRLAILEQRRQRLIQNTRRVNRLVSRRWARYRSQRAHRLAQIAQINRRNATTYAASITRTYSIGGGSYAPTVNYSSPRTSTPAPTPSTSTGSS